MKRSGLCLMQCDRGGQQRDVKREVIRPKQWARKTDLYGNTLNTSEARLCLPKLGRKMFP